MRLFFLRHGIAEDHRPDLPDARRALTPEGIEEMEAVGRGMRALDLRIDSILTSPLVRARETATLAAQALGLEDRLKEEPALSCDCDLERLSAALASASGGARILLVGHEPDFSEMISDLIGGGAVRIKKASLARVDCAAVRPGAGELRWLLNPEHLRLLGESGSRARAETQQGPQPEDCGPANRTVPSPATGVVV